MRIIIVGTGIGGTAAALALRRLGFRDLILLEQAAAIRTVGAGIQLSANCVRLLRRLGVGETLGCVAVQPTAHVFRDWKTGEVLLHTALGAKAEAAFGETYFHAHRADLLAALLEKLGQDTVRFGRRVAKVTQDQGGVQVFTEQGETYHADILIGADGIHSSVRQALFGADRPRFAGNVAWRALVPAERVAHLDLDKVAEVWMGPNRSLVRYYVSAGRLLNWIGITRAKESEIESWSARGLVADALDLWGDWHPIVRGMIEATPAEGLFRMGLYDRDPLEAWTKGRMAILGDAAHPMLPFHAQGAAQSIEDAWVLAGSIAENPGNPPVALKAFADRRIERATWVQAYSREMEEFVHQADPVLVAHRNDRLRERLKKYEAEFPPGQVKLYSFDADSVFTTPPKAVT
jgi:salicylate hydroxylase